MFAGAESESPCMIGLVALRGYFNEVQAGHRSLFVVLN